MSKKVRVALETVFNYFGEFWSKRDISAAKKACLLKLFKAIVRCVAIKVMLHVIKAVGYEVYEQLTLLISQLF